MAVTAADDVASWLGSQVQQKLRTLAGLDVEFSNFLLRLDEAWYGWFRWQLDLAGVELPEYDRRPPPFEPNLSLMRPPPDHSWLTFERICR